MKSKCLFFFVCLLISNCIYAQTIKYEQNAVDYFFINVFDSLYSKNRKIEFSGFTEDRVTKIIYGVDCFNPDSHFTRKLHNNAERLVATKKKIDIAESNRLKIYKINMKSYRRLKLRITNANEVEDKVYVSIELYKLHAYVDVYFFELSNDGNISRWCKTGAGF